MAIQQQFDLAVDGIGRAGPAQAQHHVGEAPQRKSVGVRARVDIAAVVGGGRGKLAAKAVQQAAEDIVLVALQADQPRQAAGGVRERSQLHSDADLAAGR